MTTVSTQLELLCELGQYPQAWTNVFVCATGSQYWLCPDCAPIARLTFQHSHVLVYPEPPPVQCEGWTAKMEPCRNKVKTVLTQG